MVSDRSRRPFSEFDPVQKVPNLRKSHELANDVDVLELVFNTIFTLLTADEQIRCFENAARHLTPDGYFVVETALPHVWISPDKSDYVHTEYVGKEKVILDVARYDPVTQLLEENHVQFSAQGIIMAPIVCRLITPGEMDLMARIAGMRLSRLPAKAPRARRGLVSTSYAAAAAPLNQYNRRKREKISLPRQRNYLREQ